MVLALVGAGVEETPLAVPVWGASVGVVTATLRWQDELLNSINREAIERMAGKRIIKVMGEE